MEIKKMNKHTLKLIIDKEDFKVLKELYGYDLSVYNLDLVDYLEECMDYMYFGDISSDDKSQLVRLKVKKKQKKAYAIFISKDKKEMIKKFMIRFETLDECIDFSKALGVKKDVSLIKWHRKYYFYSNSKLKKKLEYLVCEYNGSIESDSVQIARILELGEVMISKDAFEKLSLI